MGRWESNARGRLEKAAMELYEERGFDQTTVAEIAARAGLTERTFFRHYADKREVLFGGSGMLAELLVATVAGAPGSAAPLDVVAAALAAVGVLLEESRGRGFARRRQGIIAASAPLRERELIKLASWADLVAGALRRRGVEEPTAILAAAAGLAVFRVAFDRWVGDGNELDLPQLIRASLSDLKALAAAGHQRSAARTQRPVKADR